jgi:putative CocE/NonD family hydrolase
MPRIFPFPVPWAVLAAAAVLLGAAGDAAAQGLEYVKAHYTKHEYRIPMRDGVRLFTAVYTPKDTAQRHPILLNRTPYGALPYGVDRSRTDLGPSALFGTQGYIFVYQDVRGRWMSEGEFIHVTPHRAEKHGPREVDESSDTFDTIDWLIKNVPDHNGRVGQWGISYPGFYTAAGMIDAHPALKAASPQAPVVDWFAGDDWHHNGALFLTHAFNFLSVQGRSRPEPTKTFRQNFEHGTPDGYRFFLELGPLSRADVKYFKGDVAFWKELMQHGNYDAFWKARNLRPHLKAIRPAVMTVGGWFDAENLFGALETYKAIEANSRETANSLVMGPWLHGGWGRGDGAGLGHVRFDDKTAAFYREHIELPFFEYHLKGKGAPNLPEAYVFETGTNQWRKYDAWPPRQAEPRALYLHAGGRLGFEPPPATESAAAFDEYPSDPARPVPYLDHVAITMAPEYMVGDQRMAAQRPDVLTYQTEALEREVTLVGTIRAELLVSTTGTDSDWVVKLIDVYPDDYPDPEPNPAGVRMGGFQQLVRGDVIRGRFRNSLSDPEPFRPGEPTPVRLVLPDINHAFRPGHRIMVQVQSSWFPLVDRNPQNFVDIAAAGESDFHKATQRVYRGGDRPSRLGVLVLPEGRPATPVAAAATAAPAGAGAAAGP